jgi:hypothetical protein
MTGLFYGGHNTFLDALHEGVDFSSEKVLYRLGKFRSKLRRMLPYNASNIVRGAPFSRSVSREAILHLVLKNMSAIDYTLEASCSFKLSTNSALYDIRSYGSLPTLWDSAIAKSLIRVYIESQFCVD